MTANRLWRFSRALLRWLLGGVLALITFLILLLLALGFALSQPASRVWLAERGAEFANDYTDWRVELSDVTSPGLTHWEIGGLTLSRRTGDSSATTSENFTRLLDADAFKVNFEWTEAIDGKYIVNTLGADSIWVNSAAADWGVGGAEQPPEEESEPFDLQAQVNSIIDQLFEIDGSGLPHVVVRKLQISRLELTGDVLQVDALTEEQRAEIPLVWSITGDASLPESRARLEVGATETAGSSRPALLANLGSIDAEGKPSGQEVFKSLDVSLSGVPAQLLNLFIPIELTRAPELTLSARTAGQSLEEQRIDITALGLQVEEGRLDLTANIRRDKLDFSLDASKLPLYLGQRYLDELAGPGKPLDELRLENAEAKLTGSMPWSDPEKLFANGRVNVTSTFLAKPLKLNSRLAVASEQLTLSDTAFDWLDLSLRAAGTVDAETMNVTVDTLQLPFGTSFALLNALKLDNAQLDELLGRASQLSCKASSAPDKEWIAGAQKAASATPAKSEKPGESSITAVSKAFSADRKRFGDLGRLSLRSVNAQGKFTSPMVAGSLRLALCPEGRPAELVADVSANLDPDVMKISIVDSQLGYQGSKSKLSGWLALPSSTMDLKADISKFNLAMVKPFLPADIRSQLDEVTAQVDLRASARGVFTDPAFELDLKALGRYKALDYRLDLDAGRKGNVVTVSGIDVSLTPGKGAKAALESRKSEVNARADASQSKLKPALPTMPGDARIGLKGTISADLRVLQDTGALKDPAATIDLGITDFDLRLLAMAGIKLPPAAEGVLNTDIKLKANTSSLTTDGTLSFLQPAPYLDELIARNAPGSTRNSAAGKKNSTSGTAAVTTLNTSWNTVKELLKLDVAVKSDALDRLQAQDKRAGKGAPVDLKAEVNLTPYRQRLFAMIGNNPPPTSKPWPLDGRVIADAQLTFLNVLSNDPLQIIKGDLALDLAVKGTTASPAANGFLVLKDGYFEQKAYGTLLQDMQVRMGFKGSELTVEKGDIRVADSGRITLSGDADWQQQRIDMKVAFKDANLIRQPGLSASISGDIAAKGNADVINVDGKLEARPVKILLDSAIKSSIPEIDVTVLKNADGSKSVQSEPGKPLPGQGKGDKQIVDESKPVINLNVVVNAPQQIFLKGRGLDAELKGNVRVAGTAANPVIQGGLDVKRGHMDLFNRRFNLDRGQVSFANNAVAILITGVYEGDDNTFRADVSGTTSDLKIELSSVPALPQDEIIARILFGKSVQDISPIQAVQLASAVKSLQGGGGFDPLGSAQKLLGVDSLTVGSQDDDKGKGVNVGIGKYVTDKVYVELERTAEVNQPWKGSVEIELRPNVSLETSSGGQGGFGGVELKWKRDY